MPQSNGRGNPAISVVVPVRNEAGNKGDLKAGASFRAQEAAKQADGTYTTSRISVGRDGARPF